MSALVGLPSNRAASSSGFFMGKFEGLVLKQCSPGLAVVGSHG